MSNFTSSKKFGPQMPKATDRPAIISSESTNKAPGRSWITAILTGALLLVLGLVILANAGVGLLSLVLIPTGVACFLIAAVIRLLEMIHAELRELNGKR